MGLEDVIDEGRERKEEDLGRFSKEFIVELEEWVSIRVMDLFKWRVI